MSQVAKISARCLLGIWIFSSIANSKVIPKLDLDDLDDVDLDGEDWWDDELDLGEMADGEMDPTGLFYDEYLRKVMKALETHPKFREQLESHDFDDIKKGNINIDIKSVSTKLQQELDHLKRTEVERIRHLIKAHAEFEREGRVDKRSTEKYLKNIADHFHQDVPHRFGEEDIVKLMKTAAKDMDDFDQDRHDKFKKYEMHKKMREDSKLAGMTPEEQVMERKRLEDLQAKHDDHDKINYPGHKKQMEEIWEEDDEMKDEEFEPKAFFSLHDTNSDGFWDIYEVEIMMNHELKKAWDEDNKEEDDMVEMEEERLRMREEFMKNADSNKDKMISRAEWLKYAEGDEFSKEDDWDTVDDMVKNEKVYSAEELKDYKEYIEEFEADFKKKFVELIETSDKLTEKKDEHVKLQGTVNRNGLSHEILDTHRDKISEKQEVLDGLAQEVRDMAKTLTDMNIDFQDMSDSGKEAYEKKLDQVEAQQKKMLARAERKINEIMEVHKGSETEL